MDPNGMAALVTGGGSGLGEAVARALARRGAKVTVLDRDLDRATAVAAQIGGAALACDVGDADGATAALAAARDIHGPARILVNCAGIAPAGRIHGRKGPMPLDDFAKVVFVNLIGTFNMMRLAAGDMIDSEPLADGERGIIINTSSIAAFEGQIGQCAYAASKGGVASLTLPAARELARHGIRVMAIAPGVFGTPMVIGMPAEVQEALVKKTVFPTRLGTPEEFASLVLQMVENPMLNGSVIRLDGAVRMEPS